MMHPEMVLPVSLPVVATALAVLALGGAAAGVTAAALGGTDGRADQRPVAWRALAMPAAVAARAAGVTAPTRTVELLASGAFGAVDAATLVSVAQSAASGPGDVAAAQAAFPAIVAVALVDGVATAYLRGPDGTVAAWRVGEAPAAGWHIVAIGLDAVEARRGDGTAAVFPVFGHGVVE